MFKHGIKDEDLSPQAAADLILSMEKPFISALQRSPSKGRRSGAFGAFPVFLAAAFSLLALSSCSLQRAARPGWAAAAVAEKAAPVVPEKAVTPPFDGRGRFAFALSSRKLGNADAAASALEDIRKLSPDATLRARASFLLGLYSIEDGRPRDDYFKDAAGLPHMDDYLIFYRAAALLKEKQPAEAAPLFDSLITLHPDSALRAKSLYMSAASLAAAGDFTGAQKRFERFISDYPKDRLVPDALAASASASLELGRPDQAAAAATEVIVRYPARRASKDARSLLDEIKAKGGVVPELTDRERFERANRLFGAYRYASAAADFSALAGEKGPYRDGSAIGLARVYMRIRRYDRAERTLNDYLGAKRPEKEAAALYLLACAASREGKEKTLLGALKRLADRYPKSEEYGKTLLLAGKFYEPQDPAKAKSFYDRAIDVFGDGSVPSVALEAIWDAGWMDYRAGRYGDAYGLFASYGRYERRDDGKFLYWSGRCAEKLGRPAQAADFYGRVCDVSGGYYCAMAKSRGAAPDPPADARQEKEPAFPENRSPSCRQAGLATREPREIFLRVYGDDHYLKAKELLAMGLGRMASKEAEFIADKYSADPEETFALARVLLMAGDYHDALRVYGGYLSCGKAQELGTGRAETLSLAYPYEVVDLIERTAPGSSDPYLAAAVMREESAFDPAAVSITGALGLMQIMPATGRTLAMELGRKDFDPKELLDPSTNILFGSRYLGELSSLFGGNVILAVAGYNAGPHAAARWADGSGLAPDEFIESIPYDETRRYTKRVLGSYMEFLELSGETNPVERVLKHASN